MFRKFSALTAFISLLACHSSLRAQSGDDAVRVTMTMNPDGSKTVYRVDAATHESVGTTTTASGKPGGKIIYRLDAEGRYETGRVFAPNGTFRFKTVYRYNSSRQLAEETQLDQNDAVRHKIVYSFDAEGHPTGYAIYDGAGALLGQTTPKAPAAKIARARR
jgi:YD repeat-containing protein